MTNLATPPFPRKPSLREAAGSLAAAWAALGPQRTADLLGLRYRRARNHVLVLCPWHEDSTPSCSIAIGRHGTIRVHCFSCSRTWDIHSLVARVHGLDTRTEWPRVLALEADLLRRSDLHPDDLRAPQPAPAPSRPPTQVVAFLLGRCVRVTDDSEISQYLARRALDPASVALRDLAYALPHHARLPRWCHCRGLPWTQTGHRLLVPSYDAHGSLAGVRAVRITYDDAWPKRLSPAGYTLSGTVLADSLAREILRRGAWPTDWSSSAPTVVVAEGEPDFLTFALETALHAEPQYAVFGVYSTAWSATLASRIPDGATVYVATHTDEPGRRYAQQIRDSLSTRCDVYV